MNKICVAQIGTSRNSHGNFVFGSLRKQSSLFEVAGVAFPENEEEKYPEQTAAFDGVPRLTVEQLLSDPSIEAVTVETEEKYLTKYAALAVKAGKHIHMEKPGGTDEAAFDALIDTVKAAGTVFHTGYMYRFNPVLQELFRRIEAGELGEIISVEAQMNCIEPEHLRQWLGEYPGGMMFFLGCHLADLVYRIQGRPLAVHPFCRATGVNGTAGLDYGMAVWDYGHGVSLIKTSAYEIGGFSRRQLVVTGTKGTVEVNPLERYVEGGSDMFTGMTERFESSWLDNGVQSTCAPFDRYDSMMAHFAARIHGLPETVYTPDYEKELYHLMRQSCGK